MPKFTATDRAAIKAAIQSMGVLQAEIAEECGASKTAVSVWLNGGFSSPSLDKAIPAFVAGVSRGIEVRNAA
jgi:transcriptional regulator with XRE-family HTH domain